jgi:hypothetical protein
MPPPVLRRQPAILVVGEPDELHIGLQCVVHGGGGTQQCAPPAPLLKEMRRTLSEVFDDMLSTWTRGEAEQFATSLERFTTMLEQRR